MTAFVAEHGAVSMLTGRGSIRLEVHQVDQLLGIFDCEAGRNLFNALWDARADLAVAPLIPVLEPITVTVRALDPRIWAAVPNQSEAA